MEQWKLYCVVEPYAGASIHGDPLLHLLITKNQKKDDGCRIEKILLRVRVSGFGVSALGASRFKKCATLLGGPVMVLPGKLLAVHITLYILRSLSPKTSLPKLLSKWAPRKLHPPCKNP